MSLHLPSRAERSARARRLRRTAGISGLVLAVTAGLTGVPAAADAAPKPKRAHAQAEKSVAPGPKAKTRTSPANPVAAARMKAPAAVAWPAAGERVVDVAPATAAPRATVGAAAGAAGLPIAVTAPGVIAAASKTASATGRAPSSVRVRTLEHAASQRFGSPLAFQLSRADAAAGRGQVKVSVSYGGFAGAYGADYASRLRLAVVPGCAQTTPEAAACQPVPVASVNDAATGTVTATVDLPAAAPAATGRLAASALTASAATTTLALTSGPSGDAGDFTATPLKASSTWSAGTQSGDFSWSYPLRVPSALNGPAPDISFDYSAQSVDGEMGATNNQPGPIGEGFSYHPGSISRSYKSCADDMGGGATNSTKTGDQCWATDNATLSLSGHSGELIKGDNGAGWHLKNDDNTKIELLTGATNGDNDGEYWLITTSDGMKYYFGLNHLKGWTSGKATTNSVNTAPVFGNNSGEPCYKSSFASAYCDQAWQWNLDYVVDPRGNTESFWYTQETNYYARDLSSSSVSKYVRGSYLTRIDYGTDQRTNGTDSDLTGKAPMKVEFAAADRCLPDATCDTAHPASWPDVPWDQNCTSSTSCKDYSPTFFTQKRFDTVTTYVLNPARTGWDAVEKWTLHQSYPDPGDRTRAGLWLDSISHAGVYGGANTTVPDVKFTGIQLQNRVDTHSDNLAKMNWWRISSILTESGDLIGVTYYPNECAAGSTPAPDDNSKRCYPVWWTKPGDDKPSIDWFNKYVVKSVAEDDQTGGAPRFFTQYAYATTGPMWHYDDDNGLVKDAQKTWGQWRGYSTVTTTVGDSPDPQTETKTLYYQGMNGDKTSSGQRTATVVDSAGKSVADDDPFAGQTRETITYNGVGGDEVSAVVNDAWKSAATASRTVAGYTKSAYHTGISATYHRTALDGGRGYQRTETDTTFDSYGMPTDILDKGDTARGGDETCTVNTYNRNTGLNILTTVGRIQKFTASCATPSSESGVISDEEDSFDLAAYGVAPTYGNVSRVQKAKTWTTSSNIAWVTESATTAFDPYGRPTDVRDVRGNNTHTEYTPAADGPVTSQKQTAKPFDWVTTTEINPAFGVATGKVDQNNKRTDITYDGLGRKTAIWLPNQRKASSQTANATFAYHINQTSGVPSVVATSVLNAVGNYNTSYTFYDGKLRERQDQKPGIGGGTVVSDTLYNTVGEKVRTDGPYFSGDASPSTTLIPRPTTETAVNSATTDTYDGAGRVVAESTLVNNFTKWSTTKYYGGDHTDVTPPAGGTPTSTVTDALGRTVEVRQYPGSTPTGSVYNSSTTTYDAKGRRSRLADDASHNWTYTYDLLGRATSVTDPDSGTITSTYSDAGYLLTVADANHAKDPAANPVTVYDYDAAGRKVAEYLGAKTGTKLAAWTYDTLAKGQLASSSRFVDGNEYKTAIIGYNPLYKPAGTTVTLPGSEGSLAGSYTISSTYNVDGSINSTTLPATGDLAAENLNYSYDQDDGLVYSLKTDYGGTTNRIVYSTQYTSFGEQAVTTFSDNSTAPWAQQVLTYDPGTRRLAENKLLRSVGSTTLSDVHTSYDPAGNITELADTPDTGTADIQCFAYDSLRRLTQAWTPGTGDCAAHPAADALGGAAPYWKSWTFDGNGVDGSTGSRLSETTHTSTGDTTVASAYGDPAHPHAVTSTTVNGTPGGTYTYDPDGDTTGRPGPNGQQALTWDADGRLASLTDTTGSYTYVYDADGSRLVQHTPHGTTLYLDGVELTLSGASTKSAVRYYAFNGQVVAQRSAAGLQFLTGDPHGSAAVAVTDDAALTAVHRYTDPYGNDRGPAVPWVGPRAFVGGDQDQTGLIHEGAREYDSLLGRFTSVDPKFDDSEPQSWNNYAYSNNDPINFSDPAGTSWGWLKKAVKVVAEVSSVASIIPGPIGMVAAGISAVAYAAEGDYVNAGIAAAGIALSAVGAGAAVVAVKAAREAKAVKGVVQGAEDLEDAAKVAREAREAREAEQASKDAAQGSRDGESQPGCGGNSFTPETPVVVADGAAKAIKDVRVGDLVRSTDPLTGETAARPVSKLHRNQDTDLADVAVVDQRGHKSVLHTTQHHQFWDQDRHLWVKAGQLPPGHHLVSDDGSTVVVVSVRNYTGSREMFDLTVDGYHTFYVVGSLPVLVHNMMIDPACPIHSPTGRPKDWDPTSPQDCTCGGAGPGSRAPGLNEGGPETADRGLTFRNDYKREQDVKASVGKGVDKSIHVPHDAPDQVDFGTGLLFVFLNFLRALRNRGWW